MTNITNKQLTPDTEMAFNDENQPKEKAMELVKYDAMVNAIQVCERVDEVKDIRDKAVALEAYAKQANNFEAERQCGLIRVRAERKCGQMLKEVEKAKGNQHVNSAKSNHSTEQPKTLTDMGISKDQSSQWQKLANVPEEEFEEAVSLPGTKPSTRHILRNIEKPVEKEPVRMDKDALWLWGTLRDMRENGTFDRPIAELEGEWTDGMKKEAFGLINQLVKWVSDYE